MPWKEYTYWLGHDEPCLTLDVIAWACVDVVRAYHHTPCKGKAEVQASITRLLACLFVPTSGQRLTNNPLYFRAVFTRQYLNTYLDRQAYYQFYPDQYARDQHALQGHTWQDAYLQLRSAYKQYAYDLSRKRNLMTD